MHRFSSRFFQPCDVLRIFSAFEQFLVFLYRHNNRHRLAVARDNFRFSVACFHDSTVSESGLRLNLKTRFTELTQALPTLSPSRAPVHVGSSRFGSIHSLFLKFKYASHFLINFAMLGELSSLFFHSTFHSRFVNQSFFCRVTANIF